MSELSRKIAKIGCKMVHCQLHCKGITNIRSDDTKIFPRCLYLEPSDAESVDCVIVGINPGPLKLNGKEQDYYRKVGAEYQDTVEYFNKHPDGPYYKPLRRLATELGFKSILWTELCKCETDKDQGGEVPVQTFRTCIRKYLKWELKAVGPDIPLIGVSDKVYRALSYRFPNRRVIGVPHPTGSRPHTKGSLSQWNDLMKNYIEKAKAAINSTKAHECVRVFPTDLRKKDQRRE